MSIRSYVESTNISRRAELMINIEYKKRELEALKDELEGITQFMSDEDIKVSNKYFEMAMAEEER